MSPDHDRPDWAVEGRDWPNREHSRFVQAGGIAWHVQQWGRGPKLLMLHGTGAATHSWRELAPALCAHFEILAPDVPGHGFTGMPDARGLSLPGMARLLRMLLTSMGFEPEFVLGHSAGAAVAVEMTLAGLIRPKAIIAINGALLPIRGAALFSPLAKLLFLNPLAPRLFAWRAHAGRATDRLLRGTGSHIDARGVELYERLFRRPGHIAGTLGMMANWDLGTIERRLPELAPSLVLIVAANDLAVPPADAWAVARRLTTARVLTVAAGGHLVHETYPSQTAELIHDATLTASQAPAYDHL
ncbi:MAG: alpha/beta fold hydrolase [Rhizobiaceae bacterium]|nr:alpha/beta fold hydrolase [Rhizobiaceae bacterium]